MLYHNEEKLTEERFRSPACVYRAAPFWAWNCRMDEEKIDHTLEVLKDMGMGGAHIHCRTGLDNPYMSEEFLKLVKYAKEKCSEQGMLTWLYDEDRWPSGAGGGLVTKDHQNRIRFLLFTPESQDGKEIEKGEVRASGEAVRSNERKVLGRYQVRLEEDCLAEYRKIGSEEQVESGFDEWFAYLEVSGDSQWFNNEAYLNTLDKKAVERFIEVTHEKYYKELGNEFGKTIPAIFTDEPQFSRKQCLDFADEKKDVMIPYTDDLEMSFQETYGHSLLEHLPELFWEFPGEAVSRIRYEYHDHIAERFAQAYADTVGEWCRTHGIALTGHMMEEPTLETQTAALGETMRSYRSFDLPGIDMLCDVRELSTAKQAESAVHQYGREGMLSEMYGVTNWDFDFRGHKLQGDWQAALGVTVRVPHLTWTTMAGEAKRDYPAPIGYQSPWYQEYPLIEDYFARVNSALTRGVPHVRLGVIHPIESYWLYWGPREQTASIREELDENFSQMIEWLLYGTIDFDLISESLLPSLSEQQLEEKVLKVGCMKYDAVLIPNCVTLRKTTLEILTKFRNRGGKVIFAGQVPKYVDAFPSKEVVHFAEMCKCVGFQKHALLTALKEIREVEILESDGRASENMIYQMREEGENRWFFLCHVNRTENVPRKSRPFHLSDESRLNEDLPSERNLRICIKGLWNATEFQAMTGEIHSLDAEWKNGKTVLRRKMYDHDSLLLWLTPYEGKNKEVGKRENSWIKDESPVLKTDTESKWEQIRIPDKVEFVRQEENVSILDMAEYAFDGGAWQPKEEILRIDNLFREKLGYPLRMEAFAQPWTNHVKNAAKHTLSLRFFIHTEIKLEKIFLAMENDDKTKIFLDKTEVPNISDGWYVDKCIRKIPLPDMETGIHELILEIPYHSKTDVEAMFLLGDFRVRMEGIDQVLTSEEKYAAFADITRQGYPFYGGNITYKIPFTCHGGEVAVHANLFRAPVIKVWLDGKEMGYIAFSPYEVSLGVPEKGSHILEITVFGSRVNTFGTLHNCDQKEKWYGPNTWRSSGDLWSYEYQVRPAGLLKAPVIKEKRDAYQR